MALPPETTVRVKTGLRDVDEAVTAAVAMSPKANSSRAEEITLELSGHCDWFT